jgi:non-ribosomal peptide synthetase component E (peptide arylation enzyme)
MTVCSQASRGSRRSSRRYREKGYWQDRPLFDGLRDGLRRYADRVAIIDVEWDELGYEQSVMDLVFHANAERVLGI